MFTIFSFLNLGLRAGATQQDAIVAELDPAGTLLAVIDGMGGHSFGDLAAQIAKNEFEKLKNKPLNSAKFRSTFGSIETKIQRIKSDGEPPGCVVTAIWIYPNAKKGILSHVGDTRAFLSTESSFLQLTKDESPLSGLQLTESAKIQHYLRSRISNCLGGRKSRVPRFFKAKEIELPAEGAFFLCSDGVHGALHTEILAMILDGLWGYCTPEKVQKSIERIGEIEDELNIFGAEGIFEIIRANAGPPKDPSEVLKDIERMSLKYQELTGNRDNLCGVLAVFS